MKSVYVSPESQSIRQLIEAERKLYEHVQRQLCGGGHRFWQVFHAQATAIGQCIEESNIISSVVIIM